MSMTKGKGGLGFRSLYGFNITLLGRLCWNLINNPSSLVARVLKARYYPHSHFLNSTVSSNYSYIWQGIIKAKEYLRDGFRCVLGDGRDIKAVQDPWLAKKPSHKADQHQSYMNRD